MYDNKQKVSKALTQRCPIAVKKQNKIPDGNCYVEVRRRTNRKGSVYSRAVMILV